MKILFIAPLPPPVNGHSLASKVFLEDLKKTYQVDIVNLRKESLRQGVDSIKRVKEILRVFYNTYKKKKDVDLVYFTISQSLAGNLKDLVICLLCYVLLPKMYIHLHGGSLNKLLFQRHKIIFLLNRFILKRVAGAIVSGSSHINIFENIIVRDKIHIAKNFAEDYLFTTEKQIIEKFSNTNPIRILYISSMIQKKGYKYLADAYMKSSNNVKSKFRIDFVGAFDTEENKENFLEYIKSNGQINYHGIIPDGEKKYLFQNAHVFCLPTSFLEGQPISILEAYAAGCVVITTGQPGIRDIFTNALNGFEVTERSSDEILLVFDKLLSGAYDLLKIAMYNRKLAEEQYRTSNYVERLKTIINLPVSV